MNICKFNRNSTIVKKINELIIITFYEKVDNDFILQHRIKSLSWDYIDGENLIIVIKDDNTAYCYETINDVFYLTSNKATNTKVNEIVDTLIKYIENYNK